jgi:transcriptional regulator with XRE-family HTH domain
MKTLREARLAAEKTQLDLQRVTGIFQTKISQEENGIRTLTVLEMMTLEKALSTEIDWVPKRSLTANQQVELNDSIFQMMRRFGELETFKFTSRFRSLAEMYNVICVNAPEVEVLTLPDHSRG